MTATLSCTGARTVALKAPMALTGLFSRRHTWMIPLVFELVHIGVYKNTNDSNFILYRGPDSNPKGPNGPNWFIHPKTYIDD